MAVLDQTAKQAQIDHMCGHDKIAHSKLKRLFLFLATNSARDPMFRATQRQIAAFIFNRSPKEIDDAAEEQTARDDIKRLRDLYG